MLQNEVLAVQKRHKALTTEIQQETKVLLDNRRGELAQVEELAGRRLQEIREQTKAAQTELIAVSRRKVDLEGVLTGIEVSLAALEDRQHSLERLRNEAITALEGTTRRTLAAEARFDFVQAGISPLQEEQEKLAFSLAELKQQGEQLELKNVQLANEFTNRKAQIELEIADLLEKQQQLEVAQAGMYRQHQQMSEAIAVREKASDERETILKRREAKVAQDERVISRNAGLLHL